MPCDPQCPVRELNNQLINMKEEKIATLRQILGVTDELGRQAPHRRDEVARRRRQIQTKLVQAVAELVSLTDEIALGCDSCQANYESQELFPTGDSNQDNLPTPGAVFHGTRH